MKRAIAEAEVDWTAIRAQCAGGQNVNRFSSAVHLRFDIAASFFKRPTQTRTRDFVAQIL